MDLFSPLRFGVHVATGAVKLATLVPRLIAHELKHDDHDDEQRFEPAERAAETRPSPSSPATAPSRPAPARPAPPRPAATRPEPTSAAGASGGVAGTAAAPGDAAAVSAPDPTAASSTARATSTVPQGERRAGDVRPQRTTPARRRTEPTRAEIDRRRAEQRESAETPDVTLAETEGAAAPHATMHVDEPWDGYATMKAGDIVTRLKSSDGATKAVVRLYEQTHKKRKSILAATAA